MRHRGYFLLVLINMKQVQFITILTTYQEHECNRVLGCCQDKREELQSPFFYTDCMHRCFDRSWGQRTEPAAKHLRISSFIQQIHISTVDSVAKLPMWHQQQCTLMRFCGSKLQLSRGSLCNVCLRLVNVLFFLPKT